MELFRVSLRETTGYGMLGRVWSLYILATLDHAFVPAVLRQFAGLRLGNEPLQITPIHVPTSFGESGGVGPCKNLDAH